MKWFINMIFQNPPRSDGHTLGRSLPKCTHQRGIEKVGTMYLISQSLRIQVSISLSLTMCYIQSKVSEHCRDGSGQNPTHPRFDPTRGLFGQPQKLSVVVNEQVR